MLSPQVTQQVARRPARPSVPVQAEDPLHATMGVATGVTVVDPVGLPSPPRRRPRLHSRVDGLPPRRETRPTSNIKDAPIR